MKEQILKRERERERERRGARRLKKGGIKGRCTTRTVLLSLDELCREGRPEYVIFIGSFGRRYACCLTCHSKENFAVGRIVKTH